MNRRFNQGLGRPKEAPRQIEGMVMLVLSRKKNESIVINNDITIVVVEIRGDKVRLGVEAPKEIPVHRREVYDSIRRNELAVGDQPIGGSADADANGSAGSVDGSAGSVDEA
jgi:carbon storage regulator